MFPCTAGLISSVVIQFRHDDSRLCPLSTHEDVVIFADVPAGFFSAGLILAASFSSLFMLNTCQLMGKERNDVMESGWHHAALMHSRALQRAAPPRLFLPGRMKFSGNQWPPSMLPHYKSLVGWPVLGIQPLLI